MKNLLLVVFVRGVGLAVALVGLVLTYNVLVPLASRVGLMSMRTGVLPLAGPPLLVAGGFVLLVTRISYRTKDVHEPLAASRHGRRPVPRSLGDGGTPQGEGGWRSWRLTRVG